MAPKKKKEPEEPKAPAPKVVKRAAKPERCYNHKFIVETDGRVDTLASYEIDEDNSICFNCGLYFSTWIWYSEKINENFWKGVDNEAGQILNYVAKELSKESDKRIGFWGETLLEKLRERRKKNGRRF